MNPLSLKNFQLAAVLFGIATSSLFTPTNLTAQLFWDENGATANTGGTGNWDLSSSLWRDGSSTGTLGLWSSGNNAFLGGTAGTVTLNTSGISATGLSFQTTGYIIAGTASNILTLTGTAPAVDVTTGTATFSTGRIEGTSGFTKTGAGSLVIQSTSGVSGAVIVNAGTLSLGTNAGTLASATSVTVAQGATLQLNNDSVANKNDNRLGDVDVTLNGGTFNFVGIRATSGSNSNEAIDRLVLGTGSSTLSLAGSNGSSVVGLLTLDNTTAGISRTAGSTLAFVNDVDAAVSVTALTETNNIVGGWFTFDNTNFAALSGTNTGNIVAATADETSFGTSNWSAAENVVVSSGGLFQVGSDRSLNSLVLSDSTARTNLINSARSLTVGSGGLIMTGNNHLINGPGSITAGSGGSFTLFVHTTGGTTRTQTIGAVIANNGANAVSLVKAGPQTLLLTGTNTYTGTTYVNEGTLSLNTGTSNNNAIPGNVNINGGTLSYGATANQIANTSTVTMTSGGFDLGARAETISVLTMSGGTLTRQGATLTLSNASSITGGTLNFSAAASRITADSTMALGGATFAYAGGAVSSPNLSLGGDVSYAASNTGATTFTNGANAGRLDIGTGTRTFDIANSTTLDSTTPEVSVNWTVTGSANLTKSGSGTLLLQQSNTYSGGTTISGGTLNVTNGSGSATGTGNILVQNTATLQGSGRIAPANTGTITINNGGTVAIGAIESSGTQGEILTLTPESGTITTTFETGSTLRFDLFTNAGDNTANPSAADLFRTGGNLTFQTGVNLKVNQSGTFTFANGNQWRLLDWTTLLGNAPTGNTSQLILDLPTLDPDLFWDVSTLYTTGSIGIVPEPSRTLFLALGLLTLTLRRRR